MAPAPERETESRVMSPITIQIRVKPNARVSEPVEEADGTGSARVQAPPVDGRANEAFVCDRPPASLVDWPFLEEATT